MNAYDAGSTIRKNGIKGIELFQDNIGKPMYSSLKNNVIGKVGLSLLDNMVAKPVQRISEGAASIANPDLPKPASDGTAVPSMDTIEKTGLGNSFNDTIVKPVTNFTDSLMGNAKPMPSSKPLQTTPVPSSKPLQTTPVGINGVTVANTNKEEVSSPTLNAPATINNGLTVNPVELIGDTTSIDGVKKWKNDKGTTTYGNDNGMQPSTPSTPNPKLTQEQIRQIYREDPTIAMGMQNATGIDANGNRLANTAQNRAAEQNRLLQLNPIQQPIDPRMALLSTINAPVNTDIAGALVQGKQRKRAIDTLNQLNEIQNQGDRMSMANAELGMKAQDRADRIKAAEAENLTAQHKLRLDAIDKDRNYALAANKLDLEANKPITRVIDEYNTDKDSLDFGKTIGQGILMLDPKTKKWVKAYSAADADLPNPAE